MLIKRSVSIVVLSVVMLAGGVLLSVGQTRPPVPRASQKASVSQTIGTTEVKIEYSRPAVKGRTVWGDPPADKTGEGTLDNSRLRPEGMALVPYGHVWRTGANEATLFMTTDDLLVNGQPLPAGKYSLHTIPGKDEWTIIFNKDDGQWGSFAYDAKKDALRVKAKPQWLTESKEFLYFRFDTVSDNSAAAYLRWEKVKVPFTVEVKDVVGSTMARLKAFVAAAKPDDPAPRMSAGAYAKANKMTEQANAWYEDALKINDGMITTKETFQNLQRKATILLSLGRNADALTAAERALVLGKADTTVTKTQLDALEKRIADIKAGKN